MTKRPRLGFIQLHYGRRSGSIKIGFDPQCPIRRADIKPLTDKKLERYRKAADLYWAATLDLLNCFAKNDKAEPLLLGKTRCTHEITENSSNILVERSIQGKLKYADGWDMVWYYLPLESIADEERSFSEGYLDFYIFPFDYTNTKASRITSARRRLQKLKSRIELVIGRIAGLYLEDEVVNLTLQDPIWVKEGLPPDGIDGFEFQGLMLDQHEITADAIDSKTHNNIIFLVKRMDDALMREDYASVIHASASIFETMAKDIVGMPTVQNQTLKSFFSRYRIDSRLPPPILDYVLQVYDSRNIIPLAGHGSTQDTRIGRETAVTMCEITKAIIRAEYKLHRDLNVKAD